MSEANDALVAALVAKALDLPAVPKGLALDGWGRADRHWALGGGRYVFLEVETSQRHPTTNVLKYWPWLEEHPTDRAILVHAFVEPIGISPNRLRLAQWIGERIARDVSGRFWYRRIVVHGEAVREGLGEVLNAWDLLRR